jgi:hypothetical protein
MHFGAPNAGNITTWDQSILDGNSKNAFLTLSMAHELGRSMLLTLAPDTLVYLILAGQAMGLDHENQRPDAGTFVTFQCHYLDGYSDALADVEKLSNSDFTDPNETGAERMARV